MKLGRVSGNVVSTISNPIYDHRSLLLCDLIDERGRDTGDYLIAIDTVGAGDAFTGTFAVRWVEGGLDHESRGEILQKLLRWSNAAGGLAATRSGAIPSLPRREAVESLAGSF